MPISDVTTKISELNALSNQVKTKLVELYDACKANSVGVDHQAGFNKVVKGRFKSSPNIAVLELEEEPKVNVSIGNYSTTGLSPEMQAHNSLQAADLRVKNTQSQQSPTFIARTENYLHPNGMAK